MRLAIVGLALALVGCVAEVDEQPHELRGDVTFTAEERETVERAAAFVSEHTGRRQWPIRWDLPHPETADVPEGSIVRAPVGHPLRAAHPEYVGHVVGRWSFWIAPEYDRLPHVAAHELGHLSGCTHSSSIGENTMSPKAQTGAMVWTFDDDEACGLR